MTLAATASRSPPRLTRWEIIGGAALPVLSAAVQLSLLQADTVGPWLCWGYTAFGIAALIASAKLSLKPFTRGFVCGANFGCAAGFLLNAFDHFLYSYYYAWPVALVTIVPFSLAAALTGAHRGRKVLEGSGPHLRRAVAFGAFAVFLPPLLAQVAETQWVARTMTQLWDGDMNTAAAAVQAFNSYPLRFGRFATDVCEQLVIGRRDDWDWDSDQELVRQITIMLGPDFYDCEPRDPHG